MPEKTVSILPYVRPDESGLSPKFWVTQDPELRTHNYYTPPRYSRRTWSLWRSSFAGPSRTMRPVRKT